MKLIGLTGSIATGKSTVAKMFEDLGFYVIDADEIVHKIYRKGEEGYLKVLEVFGPNILNENGDIDRKKLGRVVLENKEKLKLLESIVHPLVEKKRWEILKAIETKDPNAIVIYDVPLLFEKGLKSLFDCVIVVYAPKEVQIRRLMDRDNISVENAEKRLKLQMPIDEKVKMADVVIDNSASIDKTLYQVRRVAEGIKNGQIC